MDLGARTSLLLALRGGPAFGLHLVARVRRLSRGRIRLNRGGTYLALRKLERDGLVRAWKRRTGASGRPRLYYELTPAGISEIEEIGSGLARLLGANHSEVEPAEARRMADRVVRCGHLSAHALEIRDAARRAGIR